MSKKSQTASKKSPTACPKCGKPAKELPDYNKDSYLAVMCSYRDGSDDFDWCEGPVSAWECKCGCSFYIVDKDDPIYKEDHADDPGCMELDRKAFEKQYGAGK